MCSSLQQLPIASRADSAAAPPNACYSGAYKLDHGGGYIIISPSDEGALRYRLPDGRSGRLYPDDQSFRWAFSRRARLGIARAAHR